MGAGFAAERHLFFGHRGQMMGTWRLHATVQLLLCTLHEKAEEIPMSAAGEAPLEGTSALVASTTQSSSISTSVPDCTVIPLEDLDVDDSAVLNRLLPSRQSSAVTFNSAI
jgi:hypothetical protein